MCTRRFTLRFFVCRRRSLLTRSATTFPTLILKSSLDAAGLFAAVDRNCALQCNRQTTYNETLVNRILEYILSNFWRTYDTRQTEGGRERESEGKT